MCEFPTVREITLMKQMNTKHEGHVCDNYNAHLKTLNKLLKHMAECPGTSTQAHRYILGKSASNYMKGQFACII